MRFIPILSAIIVSLFLAMFILERDRLMGNAATAEDSTAEASMAEAGEGAEITDAMAVAETGENPVPVVIQKSVAQSIEQGLVLRGRTEAFRSVNLMAEISGAVVSEPIRRGTEVSEGDVMCEIAPGTRPAELALAKAQLEEAKLNDAASSTLVERGFSSESQAAARRAQLEAAIASVERAEKDMEKLVVHAPFDGILDADTAEIGSFLQPGALCATIVDLKKIFLVGFVPERDIHKVEMGARAGGRLLNGDTMLGKVSFIARSADEATRTFRIEIEVPNADLSLRAGMTVEIFVSLDSGNAHLIPQATLTLDDQGRLGVRVVDDNIARFRPVSVIRDDVDGIWVDGLGETEDVIIVGQDFVSDGRMVIPSLNEEVAE